MTAGIHGYTCQFCGKHQTWDNRHDCRDRNELARLRAEVERLHALRVDDDARAALARAVELLRAYVDDSTGGAKRDDVRAFLAEHGSAK